MFMSKNQTNTIGSTQEIDNITQVNIPDYTGINLVCGTVISVSLIFAVLGYVLFEKWRKDVFKIKIEELRIKEVECKRVT